MVDQVFLRIGVDRIPCQPAIWEDEAALVARLQATFGVGAVEVVTPGTLPEPAPIPEGG